MIRTGFIRQALTCSERTCFRHLKAGGFKRHFSSNKGGVSLVDLSLSHAELEGVKSQAELAEALKKLGVLKTLAVVKAFEETDRALFIDDRLNDAEKGRFTYAEPYANAPVKLGYTGATMSTPHHHAVIVESLSETLSPGKRVLDMGCGSGYLAGIFSKLVTDSKEKGSVLAVECVPELAELTQINLKRAGCGEGVKVEVAYKDENMLNESIFEQKYDAIHVSFSMSHERVEQLFFPHLLPGGKILVPVHGEEEADTGSDKAPMEQILTLYSMDAESLRISRDELMPVMCQPMITETLKDEPKQTTAERIAEIQKDLDSWKQEFTKTNGGQNPTREDMFKDARIKKLFTEFSNLRKKQW
mmetsp:Transcript_7429/g.9710  ORF Transcript_7429/g.9710 Transcript_7429/m.9710 type:complete len:359 (+) Transcript_7429:121-1197(+)